MVGDLLRHFQFAAVLQIRRDAGRAESMIANPRFDAGRFRTPANDAVAPAVQGNWVVAAGGQKLFRWQMVRPAM